MKRPLADKRPIGPFSESNSRSSLALRTTYSTDRDFGELLESDKIRSEAEGTIEDNLKLDVRDPKVSLEPAGFTVGVEVSLGTQRATSSDEDFILSVLDDTMKELANEFIDGEGIDKTTRPAPDDPEYEWIIDQL